MNYQLNFAAVWRDFDTLLAAGGDVIAADAPGIESRITSVQASSTSETYSSSSRTPSAVTGKDCG